MSTMTTERVITAMDIFADAERRIWHRSVPKPVAQKCLPRETGKGWELWREYLAERKVAVELGKISKSWPLLWSLPDGLQEIGACELIEQLVPRGRGRKQLGKPAAAAVSAWLAEAEKCSHEAYALQCLAVAHALPELTALDASDWWAALARLIVAVRQAEALEGDAQALAHELLAGELSLTLALQFPELIVCRTLQKPGIGNWSNSLVEWLDGEGLTHARHLPLLRPLLASWTRTLALARRAELKGLSDDAVTQYEWLTRQAISLTRGDGSQMLTHGSAGRWESDLLQAALQLAGDEEDRAAASVLLPGHKNGRVVKTIDLPDPSVYSEWAGVAMMRTAWARSGSRVLVTFDGPTCQIELDGPRGVVFSGTFPIEIAVDGRPLSATGEWEEVCWEADDEIDYLELEIDCSGGYRLQRQFLLAREDEFLFLADAVLGESAGEIGSSLRLPLVGGWQLEPTAETREAVLSAGKKGAQVIPPALPEWRSDPRFGSLREENGELVAAHTRRGRNLYNPLLIDLNRRRIGKQLTWRQLTVVEKLELQPQDVAVGYRVQVGSEQWLFYRSLAPAANRTVLAQNLVSEFLAARFDTDGEIETLIEIE